MENNPGTMALVGLGLVVLVAAITVICVLLVFKDLSALATVGISLVAVLIGGGALGALVRLLGARNG